MHQERCFLRAYNNGLLNPFEDEKSCAAALLGVQSQILNAAFVSIYNRVAKTSLARLDKAFYKDKTLVHTWGQRATLHLYATEHWQHHIAAQRNRKSWFQRNFFDDPAEYKKVTNAVESALQHHDRFVREDIKEIGDQYGEGVLSSWGGILIDMSFEGKICNLGKNGSKTQYGYTPNWFKGVSFESQLSEKEANMYMMEQYFKTYAPASFADFCHWRGVSRKKANPWFQEMLPSLRQWQNDLYVHQDTKAPEISVDAHFTKLLYRFDPLLLAYQDKTWLADKQHHKAIWAKAAHVNPVVLQNEGVTALWNFQKSGSKNIDFWVRPLRKLSATEKKNIETEANKMAAFLERGIKSFSVID